ncbi:PPE domain-containing protein [Actinosynnema sp. NPDC002837]
MATERVELRADEARRLAREEREIDLVLTDTQNWASRSHRELYEAVHNNNDPGQTGEIGAEWGQFGTELTEAARLINERVAVSESGWTGDAADAARLAIKGLADWVTHTAETAVEVGKRVQDESQIMENARASMPEPVEFNWDQATGVFTAGGIQGLASSAADVQAANEHARALHEHAVTVMSTMERESQAVDQTTPQFSAPFNPVTGRTEEPQVALMRATSTATLAGAAADSVGGAGGATAPSAYTATQPAQQMQALRPMEPAQAYQPSQSTPATQPGGYSPAAASYQTAPGSYGSGTYASGASAPTAPSMPSSPQPMYRPEGTTAAAAAAQVPVANPYTPPSGGGNYTYTPPANSGYTPPGGSGYVPPYQPANPNTAPRQGGGTLPPGVKPPTYVPAGSPGTPPLPGMPGGGGGGGGGGVPGARMPGGGMPPGGFGGGGGAGGFGPTGSGGAGGGGSLAAGGSTGAIGNAGPRGPMPVGGFGPGGAAAGTPMAGGAPMGGAGAGGQGGEDKEHRAAAYIRGEDIFEVPGENLPPSVIGGAKPKKKGDQP